MADAKWTNIKTTAYSGAYGIDDLKITLQWDSANSTPKKLILRFKGSSEVSKDRYYILIDPNGDNEQLKLLKNRGDAAINTSSFTVTKDWNDKKFVIPTYWICHTGSAVPYQNSKDRWCLDYWNDRKNAVESHAVYTWFASGDWWHNSRMNFKTAVSSDNFTANTDNGLLAKAITAKKPKIEDNGNNTFTITFYNSESADNNALKSNKHYWKYAGGSYTSTTSTSVTKSITCKATTDTQTIYAYTKVDGTYNDVTTDTTSLAVKNYQAPSDPKAPSIDYKKSRLTIKEDWTINWGAASATNSNSKIKHYRVRLYKQGPNDKNFSAIPIVGEDGTVTTKNGSDYYYDREVKHGTSMPLYAAKCGLAAGDKVKIGIQARTTNGKGSELLSGQVFSNDKGEEVKHAGIVHTKIGSNWKEGQVYVRVGSNWKEAESVQVYTSKGWKEST